MSSRRIDALEPWMAQILNAAGPGTRRKLSKRIATDLRRSQADRIARQEEPDGTSYHRRRIQLLTKTGRIRKRQEMFKKLRTSRFLKLKATASRATVGFDGRGRTSDIARVHQYGLKDHPQEPGPLVRYRQRKLLGYTDEDRDRIANTILDAVTPD
ncbi:phage virion morphogenesis protein [Guyparkeria sp. GHLCS8-2]|uniref:phage virion morphogenesis protein n=1 Tax=Guyparkeria halopsychrophila TaxID=3139421 RepID=UPI0037CC3D6A